MKLEQDFDKLIDILYDDKKLQSKRVSSTEMFIFSKEKQKIDWTVEKIILIIVFLMKDGYILLKNDNNIYTDGPTDQYILVKNNV